MSKPKKSAENIADEIVEEIKSVSIGVKKLLSGKLTQRAIVVLVHAAVNNNNIYMSQEKVQAVLEVLEDLCLYYVKPPHEKP